MNVVTCSVQCVAVMIAIFKEITYLIRFKNLSAPVSSIAGYFLVFFVIQMLHDMYM